MKLHSAFLGGIVIGAVLTVSVPVLAGSSTTIATVYNKLKKVDQKIDSLSDDIATLKTNVDGVSDDIATVNHNAYSAAQSADSCDIYAQRAANKIGATVGDEYGAITTISSKLADMNTDLYYIGADANDTCAEVYDSPLYCSYHTFDTN